MTINFGELSAGHRAVWRSDDDPTVKFASSAETRRLLFEAAKLRNTPSPSVAFRGATASPKSIDEQLYESLASVKVYTSQVAMHMDRIWRDKLFRQLDSLLDADEWMAGDVPLQQASFATFLKALFLFRPGKRPGLGLSAAGNLIGSWCQDSCHLTIECFPGDAVRYILSHEVAGKIERAAGETSIGRLPAVLSPFNLDDWLARKENLEPSVI